MSVIPKIWNLCNCNKIISNIISNTTNKNLNCGSLNFQRFLSKRFTIGRGCKKPKKIKCNKDIPKRYKMKTDEHKQCPECIINEMPKKPSKAEVKDVCTPFRKKVKKCKTIEDNTPRCKAGMKDPCEADDCAPMCSLTKGKRQKSCNECPQDVGSTLSKQCPKGTWKRGD